MSGSAPTIGEHLVARLPEAGARYVFDVPGDYNPRLLDAIEASPELEWVGNANELNAAYAPTATLGSPASRYWSRRTGSASCPR